MKVCIYCGSSGKNMNKYIDQVTELGSYMAEKGVELIYGGASSGLMGAIADAVLSCGGRVTGVIPKAIIDAYEVAHHGLTHLHIVDSMHERKLKMIELSDAFIALPGGLGTFEEIFEVLSWNQIGFIDKPSYFFNISGYYDKLREFMHHAVDEQFVYSESMKDIFFDDSPKDMIDRLLVSKELSA